MHRFTRIGLLFLSAALVAASSSSSPTRMKADYVEACSCHAFCPCYFNKQAEHPYCEFNMAVKCGKDALATLIWAVLSIG